MWTYGYANKGYTNKPNPNKVRISCNLGLFLLRIDKGSLKGKATTFTLYFTLYIIKKETFYIESVEEAKVNALQWAKEIFKNEIETIDKIHDE